MTPHGAIYNKVSVWSDAGKTTERLKIQSLGCFAYDSEVSAVLLFRPRKPDRNAMATLYNFPFYFPTNRQKERHCV